MQTNENYSKLYTSKHLFELSIKLKFISFHSSVIKFIVCSNETYVSKEIETISNTKNVSKEVIQDILKFRIKPG